MNKELRNKIKKIYITKKILPIVCLLWFVGVFFLGWKTVLWTVIGLAIGGIVKTLKENGV